MVYFTELWDVFSKLDSDGDRRLTFAEFRASLDTLGEEIAEEDALDEFEMMDTDGSESSNM